MRRFVILCLIAFTVTLVHAQELKRDTHHFATHDGQELYLDVYHPECGDSGAKHPCMIYVFGGGFVQGERYNNAYEHYFRTLTRQGISVVSIDYRLGLKDVSLAKGKKMGVATLVSIMQHAIDVAVEDLYAATRYILEHAEEWSINRSMIMISGSSAGAITALQAEWSLCNRSIASRILPRDFRYAAVVSCAGAIFSASGKPEWQREPAPILFFHGTSDSNVPYDKSSILGIGFYGPKRLIKELDKMDAPYYFHSEEYVDHSLAITPIIQQTNLILQFIDDYVVNKRNYCTLSHTVDPTREKSRTRFSAKDYLEKNYKR